jgi:hypothetical protein
LRETWIRGMITFRCIRSSSVLAQIKLQGGPTEVFPFSSNRTSRNRLGEDLKPGGELSLDVAV